MVVNGFLGRRKININKMIKEGSNNDDNTITYFPELPGGLQYILMCSYAESSNQVCLTRSFRLILQKKTTGPSFNKHCERSMQRSNLPFFRNYLKNPSIRSSYSQSNYSPTILYQASSCIFGKAAYI